MSYISNGVEMLNPDPWIEVEYNSCKPFSSVLNSPLGLDDAVVMN